MMKHKHTPLYAAVAAALVPLTQSPVSLAQLPEPTVITGAQSRVQSRPTICHVVILQSGLGLGSGLERLRPEVKFR